MTAKWLYNKKIGRALMGKVINIIDRPSGKLLEIRVTSNESKQDNGKVGSCFLVARKSCIVE